MLSDSDLREVFYASEHENMIGALRAVAAAAAQAERHRIYAALEADPGALWRDHGFQEWRSKRNIEAESNLIGANG